MQQKNNNKLKMGQFKHTLVSYLTVSVGKIRKERDSCTDYWVQQRTFMADDYTWILQITNHVTATGTYKDHHHYHQSILPKGRPFTASEGTWSAVLLKG